MLYFRMACLLLCAVAHAACPQPLRVRYSEGWVSYEKKELQWFKNTLTANGCDLMVQDGKPVTFSRMLRELQEGHFDVLIGVSKTNERERYLYFVGPYYVDNARLFSSQLYGDGKQRLGLEQFYQAKHRLILPLYGWYGASYEHFRSQHASENNIVYYRHDDEIERWVHRYPDAVVLSTDRVMQSFREGGSLLKLQPVSDVLLADEIYIALSKKSVAIQDVEQLRDLINKALMKGRAPHSL